jgi:hypothetical protein
MAHLGGIRRVTVGLALAGAGASLLAGCGGGAATSTPTTAAPSTTTTPTPTSAVASTTTSPPLPPTSGAGPTPTSSHCGTTVAPTGSGATGSVTECVSDVSYFSYNDPNAGPGYYVHLDVSDANHSSQGQQAPYDFEVVDSSNHQIQDVSTATGDGQPPNCFNINGTSLNVLSGQAVDFPEPICFELSGPSDQIHAFVDVDFELTIKL